MLEEKELTREERIRMLTDLLMVRARGTLTEFLESCIGRAIEPKMLCAIANRLRAHLDEQIQLGVLAVGTKSWLRVSRDDQDPCVLDVDMSFPKWEHDCESCAYLGTVEHDQVYDLYACVENQAGMGSLLARFGNEAHEYRSTLRPVSREVMINRPYLVEAEERYLWLSSVGE